MDRSIQTGDREPSSRGRQRQPETLPSDLKVASVDLGVALVLTGLLFGFLYWQAHQGTSDTYAVMADHMDPDPDVYRFYWLSQALGWTALLWSWITVLAGLLTATRLPRKLATARQRVLRFHRATSLTTILLMAGHAWILVFGNMGETLLTVLVPWTGYEGGRFPLALGFGAFYGSILLGLTFYFRNRLGHRAWRAAHRLTILVYVLGVWHTLIYGSNVSYEGDWVRILVWFAQLPVAVALFFRILRPLSHAERIEPRIPRTPRMVGRWALAGLAATSVVTLLLVVAMGWTGGDPRPVDPVDVEPGHHGH